MSSFLRQHWRGFHRKKSDGRQMARLMPGTRAFSYLIALVALR